MTEHKVTMESTLKVLLEQKKYSTLKDILVTMNPSDVAELFGEIADERLPRLFRLLPKELAAETFIEMQPEEQELLIRQPIDEVVLHYARNAKAAGLDGVVCSPLEAGKVHEACGNSFLAVTPGVRFADGDIGDQKRVTTPAQAKQFGSDYIVVGRPITQADDPVEAWHRCLAEFC